MTRFLFVLSVPVLLAACNGKGGGARADLKTAADSASYALGIDLAYNLKQQNMAGMNFGCLEYGIGDVVNGKTTALTTQDMGRVLDQYSFTVNTDSTLRDKKGSLKATTEKDNLKLENLSDSAGYAMGMYVAQVLKFNGATDLNRDLIRVGIQQVLASDSLQIKADEATRIVSTYLTEKSQAIKDKSIREGEDFLEKNGKRSGIKTTASGLQYEVITEGKGAKATSNDIFVANYRGTLIDGTEFDASQPGQPLEMPVMQVIPGWQEALQLMPVGSKYKIYIPYSLGYGLRGSPPSIPGGSALIFDLELLDVKKM